MSMDARAYTGEHTMVQGADAQTCQHKKGQVHGQVPTKACVPTYTHHAKMEHATNALAYAHSSAYAHACPWMHAPVQVSTTQTHASPAMTQAGEQARQGARLCSEVQPGAGDDRIDPAIGESTDRCDRAGGCRRDRCVV